jgi:hypothetical protein
MKNSAAIYRQGFNCKTAMTVTFWKNSTSNNRNTLSTRILGFKVGFEAEKCIARILKETVKGSLRWPVQDDFQDHFFQSPDEHHKSLFPAEIINFLLNTLNLRALDENLPIFSAQAKKIIAQLCDNYDSAAAESYNEIQDDLQSRYKFLAGINSCFIDHITQQIDICELTVDMLKSSSSVYFSESGTQTRWDDIVRAMQDDCLLRDSLKNEIESAACEVFWDQPRAVQIAFWLKVVAGEDILSTDRIGDWDVPDGDPGSFKLYDCYIVIDEIVDDAWSRAQYEGEALDLARGQTDLFDED